MWLVGYFDLAEPLCFFMPASLRANSVREEPCFVGGMKNYLRPGNRLLLRCVVTYVMPVSRATGDTYVCLCRYACKQNRFLRMVSR